MNNTKNITLNSQIEYWNGQKKSVNRNGLGMNPRQESGSIRQIQTGAIINPNNAPPVNQNNLKEEKIKFFQNLKQKTLDEISELYVDFYMQIWQMTQTRKATRVQRWVNASRLNWNAGIFMMKTYFTQKPITVTILQNQMHITRTSARKILSDMYGEGWLTQHEIDGDKRKLGYIATDEYYKNWEQYVTVLIDKSNTPNWIETYGLHRFARKNLNKIMHT